MHFTKPLRRLKTANAGVLEALMGTCHKGNISRDITTDWVISPELFFPFQGPGYHYRPLIQITDMLFVFAQTLEAVSSVNYSPRG